MHIWPLSLWCDHEVANGLDIYIYMIMMGFSDLWWWLRNTTGPYERPMIEGAYGKIMIHSTKAAWEILAREKWLGYRHDSSPMVDIPGSTPVWAQYTIFFCFHDINIYIYYVLKSICIIKRNTGGLWPRLGPTIFREGFQSPMGFKRERNIQRHRLVLI